MKKNLIILIISLTLFLPSFLFAENVMIVSGKAVVYNNKIKPAKERAKKQAIAKGIFKILAKKIPIQYMRKKYTLLKREFGDKGESFIKKIEEKKVRQAGTSLIAVYEITWDMQKIFERLGELDIIPLGAIPPRICLKFEIPGTDATDIDFSKIKEYFVKKIKSYNFPITSVPDKSDYYILFSVKDENNPLSNEILTIKNLLFKITVLTSKGKKLYDESVTHVSTLINSDYLIKELNGNFTDAVKKLELNWYKRNKRMKKLRVIFKSDNKLLFPKLFVNILKNSDKISSVKMVKLSPEKGMFYIVYYKPSFKKEVILEELKNVCDKMVLTMENNGKYVKIGK